MNVEEMKPKMTFEQEPLWDYVQQRTENSKKTEYKDLMLFLTDRKYKHTKAENIVKVMKRDHLLQHDRDGSYIVDFGRERESRLEELVREYYTKSIWTYILISIFLVGIPFGWYLGARFSSTIQLPTASIVGLGFAGLVVLILLPLLQRTFKHYL
jgi:hypothetical protein